MRDFQSSNMQMILSFLWIMTLRGQKIWSSCFVLLSSCRGSRSISIRVNCFATEQPKRINSIIHKFSGVIWAHFHLGIWVFLCIIKKLMNKDRKHVEERFQKRLNRWRSKMLSVGGRLVLLNSVLSSLPMFMLSFFELPKGVLKKLDYFRSRFCWQSDEHKKKYRLTK